MPQGLGSSSGGSQAGRWVGCVPRVCDCLGWISELLWAWESHKAAGGRGLTWRREDGDEGRSFDFDQVCFWKWKRAIPFSKGDVFYI